MVLTTNCVSTFDPAFQSHIHISLDYPELSTVSRKTIWENFLSTNDQEHTIDKGQLTKLAAMNVNGCQIKNVLRIARLLALRKDETISFAHIATTLDVTQHLHKESQTTERTRGSLYGQRKCRLLLILRKAVQALEAANVAKHASFQNVALGYIPTGGKVVGLWDILGGTLTFWLNELRDEQQKI
jgi:hypothetical protein